MSTIKNKRTHVYVEENASKQSIIPKNEHFEAFTWLLINATNVICVTGVERRQLIARSIYENHFESIIELIQAKSFEKYLKLLFQCIPTCKT